MHPPHTTYLKVSTSINPFPLLVYLLFFRRSLSFLFFFFLSFFLHLHRYLDALYLPMVIRCWVVRDYYYSPLPRAPVLTKMSPSHLVLRRSYTSTSVEYGSIYVAGRIQSSLRVTLRGGGWPDSHSVVSCLALLLTSCMIIRRRQRAQ